MHKCVICNERFDLWVLYDIHKQSFHMEAPVAIPGVKHPLTRAAKALLVARGEARLGAHNFYGGAI